MALEREMRDIPCQVSPGMFQGEVAVVIKAPDGNKYGGVFDKSYVKVDQEITDTGVKGRFGVEIIEKRGDGSVLVEFTSNPAQHLLNTPPRAWLPVSFLLPQEEVVVAE